MLIRPFSSAPRQIAFKSLPPSYFLDLDKTLQDDTSPDKTVSLKTVLPKIRQELHQVSERHAYKLLFPLARLETHNQLLTELLQSELIEPMRTQNYTSELFTS